ncbi:hypothetical protein PN36_29895 [Candidatus Thiomargarita nelsonii]|uniref:Uncharacterized protein n=1 Tax=Candidatus Thiomargarita nelsonii TaxID=1003181 RepID=A0A0A6PD40_9GAMM|nr:hypothetical protein PN36_29895 [Candidatus Thiomargarita nelsonii]
MDRVFISGISPEVASVLSQVIKDCDLPPEKADNALTMMHTFYDGYCFSDRTDELIYNPTLTLYFLKFFQRYCQYPRRMLDGNLGIRKKSLISLGYRA